MIGTNLQAHQANFSMMPIAIQGHGDALLWRRRQVQAAGLPARLFRCHPKTSISGQRRLGRHTRNMSRVGLFRDQERLASQTAVRSSMSGTEFDPARSAGRQVAGSEVFGNEVSGSVWAFMC